MASSPIWHILSEPDWLIAQTDGRYSPPSLEIEGYLHFSTSEQLPAVVQRHYPGQEGLRVLKIEAPSVLNSVRYEPVHGSDYPHLYRALQLDEVGEILLLTKVLGTLTP